MEKKQVVKNAIMAVLSAAANAAKDEEMSITTQIISEPYSMTVSTLALLPKSQSDIIISDYFKKEIKKTVPAVANIVITDEGDRKQLCIDMFIPNSEKSKWRCNTVENANTLAEMGEAIVKVVIANAMIPKTLAAIGADCKPWFVDSDETTTQVNEAC